MTALRIAEAAMDADRFADGRPAEDRPARERVALRWYGDWTTLSSAAVLLALAPLAIICLLPFAWLTAFLLPGNVIVWMVAYFAVIPVAMVPGFGFLQVWLVGRNTRAPTAEEWDRLSPAWETVRAQVDKGAKRRWRLRVIEIDNVNAAAAGGSLVMVTDYALRALPDDELQAILAHELGHHAGLHPITLLAQSWLMRPILWADWAAVKLHNALGVITNFSRMNMFVLVVLLGVQLVIRVLVLVLRLIVQIAFGTLMFFQRKAEHKADDTAVTLGFGAGLLNAMHRFERYEAENDSAQLSWWSNTHPTPSSRIMRILARMERL